MTLLLLLAVLVTVAVLVVVVVVVRNGAVLHVARSHALSKALVYRAYRAAVTVTRGHKRYSLQRQMV
jgi:hypothetical protein